MVRHGGRQVSFAAAIRPGSITRAATAPGLSQPVVSQRIQGLEKIVGERLVIRDARGTRVTPHGEKLLAYAERILALHDEARSVLSEDHQPFAGKRSIGLLEDLPAPTVEIAIARRAGTGADRALASLDGLLRRATLH